MNKKTLEVQIKSDNRLDLHAGEWVEVRSREEIFDTLDKRGCLDNLPFMPEMIQYCGKRYQVYKRANKTCDTITGTAQSRRMYHTVHLTDLRCDGSAHGDCDSTCLLFWKEAWLKRVVDATNNSLQGAGANSGDAACTLKDLASATRNNEVDATAGEEIFSCQATELIRASHPLSSWDVRQYWREWRSGNVFAMDLVRILFVGMFNAIINKRGLGRLFYLITGYRRYPFMDTKLMVEGGTPYDTLGIMPGEMVEVKGINEILPTLRNWRNRGLIYDSAGEMLKYSGKRLKVLKRVRKVIDEKSGKLLVLKNDSVILEGAICCGHHSPNRLLCPRSLYPFWREIWLKRVDPDGCQVVPNQE